MRCPASAAFCRAAPVTPSCSVRPPTRPAHDAGRAERSRDAAAAQKLLDWRLGSRAPGPISNGKGRIARRGPSGWRASRVSRFNRDDTSMIVSGNVAAHEAEAVRQRHKSKAPTNPFGSSATKTRPPPQGARRKSGHLPSVAERIGEGHLVPLLAPPSARAASPSRAPAPADSNVLLQTAAQFRLGICPGEFERLRRRYP